MLAPFKGFAFRFPSSCPRGPHGFTGRRSAIIIPPAILLRMALVMAGISLICWGLSVGSPASDWNPASVGDMMGQFARGRHGSMAEQGAARAGAVYLGPKQYTLPSSPPTTILPPATAGELLTASPISYDQSSLPVARETR